MVSFLSRTPIFCCLINDTIALIWCNTWWFSRCLAWWYTIWVSHFCKSQTIPTILHNEESYHQAMSCLIFMLEVDKLRGDDLALIRGAMWLWGADQLCIMDVLWWKADSATSNLTCKHFRDMTQPILAWNLGFNAKWPM